MSLQNPGTIYIAYQPFSSITKIEKKIRQEEWEKTIESMRDVFTWWEDTPDGKTAYSLPSNSTPPKIRAMAFFDVKKGYHKFVADFSPSLGLISTTCMPRLNQDYLKMIFTMAGKLNALVLSNGKKMLKPEILNDTEDKLS